MYIISLKNKQKNSTTTYKADHRVHILLVHIPLKPKAKTMPQRMSDGSDLEKGPHWEMVFERK